jgi:hypothetical protein
MAAIWAEIGKPLARAQLARILDSPQFRSSKRCSAFLRYVVEHAIENRLDSLKERTIGVEVFERDPHYDTNQDPVVRSTAGEVRKRLAQYYLETAHEDELRISLPIGSYAPEVHPNPERVTPLVTPDTLPDAGPVTRRRWGVVVLAAVVLAASAQAWVATRKSDLERFWAPVMEPKEPLVICIGQPKVYKFNDGVQDQVNRWVESGPDRYSPVPDMPAVPPSEIVPVWDRYLALSDTQAYSMIAGWFARKDRKTQLRGGRNVSLADLRGKPVVLIGAFNNEWTMSLAGELRFYFDHDRQTGIDRIRDRQNPERDEWKVFNRGPVPKPPVDYALVTRVLNPTTEQTVVIAAGLAHFGTEAAGEFLSNPEYFASMLRNAPRDWYRKNMQVVLSTKVLSGTTGPPEVLASWFW